MLVFRFIRFTYFHFQKTRFFIWCIATASFLTLCLEQTVLAAESDISFVCSVFDESSRCTLLNGQDVANQRQSREGLAEQGSVI